MLIYKKLYDITLTNWWTKTLVRVQVKIFPANLDVGKIS